MSFQDRFSEAADNNAMQLDEPEDEPEQDGEDDGNAQHVWYSTR